MKIIFFWITILLLYDKIYGSESNSDVTQLDNSISKAFRYLEEQQHSFDVPTYSIIKLLSVKYKLEVDLNDSVYIKKLNDEAYKEWYLYKSFFDTSFIIQEDCLKENITQNLLLRSFYYKEIALPLDYLENIYEISDDGNYDLLHMYWALINVEDYYKKNSKKYFYDSLENILYTKIYNAYFLKPSQDISDESVEASAFILLGRHREIISSEFISALKDRQYKSGYWCFLDSNCDNYEISYTKEYICHNTMVSLFLLLQYRENLRL